MQQDALSALLSALRLSSTVISRARFTEPWAVHTGPVRGALFHVIQSGAATLTRDDEPTPMPIAAGEVIILPRGSAHTVAGRVPTEAIPITTARTLPGPAGVALVDHGGGGAETRVLCGLFRLHHDAAQGLLSMLPPVLRVERPSPLLQATLALVDAELDAHRPGAEAVLTRLCDLVFIHALRAHVAALPAHAAGLLGALGDAQIAESMTLMHHRCAHDWTIATLAEAVGLSRSSYAERFTRLVGQPPMQYLRRWRVHQSLDRLTDPRASTAEVAEAVGYSSEDAFVRAFRRVMGETPAAWRRGWSLAGLSQTSLSSPPPPAPATTPLPHHRPAPHKTLAAR